MCDRVMLDGVLFSCVSCDDYALCPGCYQAKKFNGTHQLEHQTSKVSLPNQLGRSKIISKYNQAK